MRQKSVIEIFKELCAIPHCSRETAAMLEYLETFAKDCGYGVEIDEAGNLMARGKSAGVTLQAHYDMVCIGRAPRIETVTEAGWMRAKESSLGADNGMGMAIMLWLMSQKAPLDALFTNDEEVGLIGADRLGLSIRTPALLNLDSEEAGRVYIGCAGGEDLFAARDLTPRKAPEGGGWYRLVATAPGGHSGVNIADAIPNAITELCGAIHASEGAEVACLVGGERINAIPRRAEAVIWMPGGREPTLSGAVVTQRCEAQEWVVAEGRRLAGALFGFAHGVRGWNRELDLPQSSINLATVTMDPNRCEVALSARSMANDELARLVDQTAAGWEACGFACRREGKYPAWKPEINAFTEKVLQTYRRLVPDASYAAIHAGLECALFARKFPDLKIASVGPTILDPHSDRERVDLASVEVVTKLVERIVGAMEKV